MNNIIESFEKINSNIRRLSLKQKINIVAVSKTFSLEHIKPLIEYGHDHYGENRVQEAATKWSELKSNNSKLKLHLIGKLQTNKAKDAIRLFDYIHSVDSQKLADVLSKHQTNLDKRLKYFIQVNIGNEIQKSGIHVNEVEPFYNYCVNNARLDILGLMVIPPNDNDTKKYFKSLSELNKSLALPELSMGMSSDYIDAIKYGATFVRIGSSIFGSRS